MNMTMPYNKKLNADTIPCYFILTGYFLNRDSSLHAAASFMNSADCSGEPLEYAEYQFIVLFRGN